MMKYLVFTPPKPDYDFRTFDFDRDVGSLDAWGKLAERERTRISSKFRKRGGKLVMTYGWADAILQPMMGVNYYERGGREERRRRRPTSSGCSWCRAWRIAAGGVGPDQNDAVTAIVDWVEKGKAPESIVASKIVDGQVTRSAAAVPVSAGRALHGQGQHRRRRELPLRHPVATTASTIEYSERVASTRSSRRPAAASSAANCARVRSRPPVTASMMMSTVLPKCGPATSGHERFDDQHARVGRRRCADGGEDPRRVLVRPIVDQIHQKVGVGRGAAGLSKKSPPITSMRAASGRTAARLGDDLRQVEQDSRRLGRAFEHRLEQVAAAAADVRDTSRSR